MATEDFGIGVVDGASQEQPLNLKDKLFIAFVYVSILAGWLLLAQHTPIE